MLNVFEIITEFGIIGLILAWITTDPIFSLLLLLIFVYFKRNWILNLVNNKKKSKVDTKMHLPHQFLVMGTCILIIGIILAISAILLGNDKDIKNLGLIAISLAFISVALTYYTLSFQFNDNEETRLKLIQIENNIEKLLFEKGSGRE